MEIDNITIFEDQISFLKTEPTCYQKIFADVEYFNYKYLLDIFHKPNIIKIDGVNQYEDYSSIYLNISNHKRVTIGAKSSKNNIYIFGDSVAFGSGAEDKFTVASLLQKFTNENNFDYEIINCGVGDSQLMDMVNYLSITKLQASDIVIFLGGGFKIPAKAFQDIDSDVVKAAYPQAIFEQLKKAKKLCESNQSFFYFFFNARIYDIYNKSTIEKYLNNIKYLPASKAIEGQVLARNPIFYKACEIANPNDIFAHCLVVDFNNKFAERFVDNVHLSPTGAEITAEIIFDSLFNGKKASTPENSSVLKIINEYIDRNYQIENNTDIENYLNNLKTLSEDKPSDAGIIVMNCNPFTLGHRYLIETVAKKVSWLYILVVEEDRSTFKFADRLNMVKLGTVDLKNVTVINSGKFVISTLTFPEYFSKDSKSQVTIDASNDITIFAKHVAPALKCNKRFAGEEPFCNTTRQYNEQMEVILPKYDIDFIIYKRKVVDDKAISATQVRRCMVDKDFEGLKKLLPETTLKYLLEKGII